MTPPRTVAAIMRDSLPGGERVSRDRIRAEEAAGRPVSAGRVACPANRGDRSDYRTGACVAPGGPGTVGGLPGRGQAVDGEPREGDLPPPGRQREGGKGTAR